MMRTTIRTIAVAIAAVALTATAAQAQRAVPAEGSNGAGPSFCESGEGHPTWGRQWCVDKGFGLGTAGWGVLDYSGAWNAAGRGSLSNGELAALLPGLIGDLRSRGGGELSGQWLSNRQASILLVSAGSRPVAEVTDRDGDGRIDMVLVRLR